MFVVERCWYGLTVACLIAGCAEATRREASLNPATTPASTKSAAIVTATTPAADTVSVSVATSAAMSALPSSPYFLDVAASVGVDFAYQNGAAGEVLMVEATGGGAGWLDFDRDGLLDLYFPQGGNAASTDRSQTPVDVLFRQTSSGHFAEVQVAAAIAEHQYGQGVAIGDYDDDGFDDVYVTNVGPNTLFQNLGDGTFRDVSQLANVADPLWSVSAAWGDLDGDGDLDLYVCNYVDYDPYHPLACGSEGRKGTCHPMHVPGVPDEAYFNQGDGTFCAEATHRGLHGPDNKGLGVVIADFNNDALPDIYVANDTTANFLFLNEGAGQFTESAQRLGCAVSREGHPQASMGVGLCDYDRNGHLDIYCTHFTKESNTLYKNLGKTGFQDVTGLVGLHSPTLASLGFGTLIEDFDQDRYDDVMIVNGHVDDWRSKGDKYEMEPQLFCFNGKRFTDRSADGGTIFSKRAIARGLAKGDFDNDGDWDLAIVHQNTPAAILRNDSVRGSWLKIRLLSTGNRRGWGTRVRVTAGATTLTQELASGSSYASSHEPVLIFGLGSHNVAVGLDIQWPDGTQQQVDDVSINRELLVRQLRSEPTLSSLNPASASDRPEGQIANAQATCIALPAAAFVATAKYHDVLRQEGD